MGEKYFISMESNQKIVSSWISTTEKQTIRQIISQSKVPHNVLWNSFADTYRSDPANVFAENFNNGIELNQQSSTEEQQYSKWKWVYELECKTASTAFTMANATNQNAGKIVTALLEQC